VLDVFLTEKHQTVQWLKDTDGGWFGGFCP